MIKTDYATLYRSLGYEFKSLKYLKQALTHRSAGELNNERLEFLGDSILSFVIAEDIFHRFFNDAEGKMSRLRAYLVKGDTLAEISREIGLGDFLSLGQGELKTGGFRRSSILADSLEAVFAAVYLDGGIIAAKNVILKLYDERLNNPKLKESLKDAKTQLQEYLQANKHELPVYELVSVKGEEHNQTFLIKCSVFDIGINAKAQSSTRRKAEQKAAQMLLDDIKENFSSNS